jgi:hypothetical protein
VLPFHSATVLSPIEEESEEIETTSGIAFKLTNQDSLTKKRSIDDKDNISGFLTIDDDEKPSEKLSTFQEITSTSSHTFQPVQTVQQRKIDESKRVIFPLTIKAKYFVCPSGYYYHTVSFFFSQ